jgi:predicted PhzF superfamily epimerase YddE/YHI9
MKLTPFTFSRRTALSMPLLTLFTSKPQRRIFKYELWDVFTDRPLTGNPLAVFTGAQTLRVHARNLIPAGEDPVTGSAGGCCAAWMVKNAWAQSDESVIIEQGLEIMRPGTMKVRAKRTAEGVRDVRVSGSAVCVGTGQIEFAS